MGGRRHSSTEKLLAVALFLLAVVSPLYIDRKQTPPDSEVDDEPAFPTYLLPFLLLFFLIVSISLSSCLDQRLTRSDPYCVHRVGGSSAGIVALLLLLAIVLKIKASMSD